MITEITDDLRPVVTEHIIKHWYTDSMVINGEIIDMTDKPGYCIISDGAVEALLVFRLTEGCAEILSLDVEKKHVGTGSQLLDHFESCMKTAGISRITLVTTNDNTDAMRFYKKNGSNKKSVRPDAVNRSRMLKPEIPLTGHGGIPIADEIIFEKTL